MPQKYTRTQILVNGLINSILNGLIALFLFRSRERIPYSDIFNDVLITVAIISFFVSLITINNTRKEIIKGYLPQKIPSWPNLPNSAVVRAFLITTLCISIFGLVLWIGSIFLSGKQDLLNWVYMGMKALYAGICAGLAAGLAVGSEISQLNPSNHEVN